MESNAVCTYFVPLLHIYIYIVLEMFQYNNSNI